MKRAQENSLRQRLQTEARQESPPFSPLLHERIMAALRSEGCGHAQHNSEDRSPAGRMVWRIALPLAAAAAIALITWIALNSAPTPPAPKPPEIVQAMPPMPTDFIQPIRDLAPSANTFDQAKYAYLDRDALRLAIFVADQLPTFSTDERPPK